MPNSIARWFSEATTCWCPFGGVVRSAVIVGVAIVVTGVAAVVAALPTPRAARASKCCETVV